MPSGNLESFKFIEKGDFAISLRSFEGGLEYCHHDGIISPAYTVLKAKKLIDDLYYKYLFKSFSFISELQTSVVGIREGKNVSYPLLSYSLMPCPPLEGQTQIANFLEDKCSKIDQAIQQKEQLIQLLKERKQIIIQNAVTRGLNPDVAMKKKDIKWMQEIPKHWQVKPLKYLGSIKTGLAKGPSLNYGKTIEVPYLRVANVQDGYLALHHIAYVKINKSHSKKYELKTGDLLMNEGGDFDKLGRGYVWEKEIDHCLHQNHVFAIRMHPNVNPYWVNICTLTQYGKYYFTSKAKKTTNLASLSTFNLKNFPVVYPPLKEQFEILKYIEESNKKIDKAIHSQSLLIKKLKEYKQVLINEVVTGKVKV
jgi:type I restriction enzyme S subunit